MAWIPRFPEVKANLGVNNGIFGIMLSVGAFGSLAALLTVGHLVDHFGARRAMLASITLLCASFIAVVHVTNHELFIILNILVGFSISTMHIGINAQAFFDQDRGGKNLVIAAAGYWSAGSLATTVLSMFLIGKVSLQTHITMMYLIIWVLTVIAIYMRHETLVPPNRHERVSRSIYNDLKRFNFDWIINFGFIFGVMLEFSIADWSTIFAKEDVGVSPTWAPLPFLAFTFFMIIGRVSINLLRKRYRISTLVKVGGVLAGSSFLVGIWSVHIFGLPGLLIAFSLAGLGSSYIGPAFINVANTRNELPSGIVVGQISAVNIMLAWILKQVIAFLAQFTGLQVALSLPALMLIAVGLFTKVFKPAPAK